MIEDGYLYYLWNEKFYKLSAKVLHLYLDYDYDKAKNVGYIVVNSRHSNRAFHFENFEVKQVKREEVDHSIRVILRSSEKYTMVLPNKDLTINVIIGRHLNEISAYTHLDIASIPRCDFSIDTQYSGWVKDVRNFINEHKPKNGTLHIYQEYFTERRWKEGMDYLRNFPNVVICFNQSQFNAIKNKENEKMRENFKSLLFDSYFPRVIHLRVSEQRYGNHYDPQEIVHEVIINKEFKEKAINWLDEFIATDIELKKTEEERKKDTRKPGKLIKNIKRPVNAQSASKKPAIAQSASKKPAIAQSASKKHETAKKNKVYLDSSSDVSPSDDDSSIEDSD